MVPHTHLKFFPSEVTETNIIKNRAEDTQGMEQNSVFTPVYLKPNTSYAICVSTNADYKLWYGETNEPAVRDATSSTETGVTVRKPEHMGPMHIPLNNGTSTSYDNRYLKKCLYKDVHS